jgi:hypothetical protein
MSSNLSAYVRLGHTLLIHMGPYSYISIYMVLSRLYTDQNPLSVLINGNHSKSEVFEV